ncbi:glycosyltransferase [Mesorhizobium sp. BR1-1-16]|uniref:glycosyltransferase family 2 protein n=1 Tax=Mesorhizobium sp. BR1-1-16 TaxID=2876653 RepID=UPI001CC9E8AE|nr:glycosyltransferase [Mesorhizobium sp. BR1-1-16]MBZ9937880.1 glycosyltransferase [Mesorhizobium sp. BR1-1-16]
MSPLAQQAPAAPKVSVACAWYNRADYIQDTIDSLLAQNFDSFEVVVVNDGSSDVRVAEILDGYDDPRLRVIHQGNQGFTRAIARAVSEARGAFIAVQGSGDLSLPGRLAKQAAHLDAHPDQIGVASFRENVVIGGDRDGQRTIGRPEKSVIDRNTLLDHIGSPLNHGEVMFRRDVYQVAGGYRPVFHLAQDMDLWLRMTRFGVFGVVEEVLYQRRVFDDGVKGRVDKTLAQTKYSQMAKSCAREFDRNGADIVDLFGLEAPLFRGADALAAKATAKAALKYLRNGLPDEARVLAALAWRERPGPLPALAMLLSATHGMPGSAWLVGLLPIQDDSETRPLLPKASKPAQRQSADIA